MRIFTGNANLKLAHDVCDNLDIELGKARVDQFSDGEINVAIQENVRGMDCFIIQPTCSPTNSNLMELLIMIDALKRSSARRITAVIPYYGYARQDRQNSARMPITAKLVANLITHAGADRVMTIDIHALQIVGFFDMPVDNLFAKPVLLEAVCSYSESAAVGQVTVVSPDAGGVERARAYAKRLDAPLAIIDKRRESANTSEVMHIVGDVDDRVCLIVDDMIDTAGTLCRGINALIKAGAVRVIAAITHPVLSGKAYQNLAECSGLDTLVTTDTIPLSNPGAEGLDKIQVASIAPLLAEAIRRTHNEESISSLFK